METPINVVEDMDLCVVISEVNMVDSNPREWWLDTGATCHICCDEDSFSELQPCENGEKLYMGNAATSKIKGKGTVVFKMTSGKELKLQNLLYMPEIHKHPVFGTLLSVHGFKMIFESQKLVLSKGELSTITSIKIILAIATLRNLEIHQINVRTAFLNGDLDEEIYMVQPKGHVVLGQERKVCKLVKSLYGLKQAPK
ncbi:uncharacterized protein [Gossypium hirsutum]|uniref:Reverse transcriptase Ty1/copia-type domain-containing protein n=1 Tax=Gossypium hirsutum TaxID=3635 RepID=A0A1U8IB78_GOSHI|nr:uncharacterized protein LOC107894615 [Gossypium hirsutum]